MRARSGVVTRRKRKKLRKFCKGFWGQKKNVWRRMKESYMRAGNYAFMHRKDRKREMRRLWITRINAAARQHGLTYSQLMFALRKANVAIDRKQLAKLAFSDPDAFSRIVETAKSQIG
ncbi:MAG: 50S ribosomal protein L20 [Planctomycetota bacterium]|nr:MAG: 50S ribosomal protein L20 [Planctomycetota bacterium]